MTGISKGCCLFIDFSENLINIHSFFPNNSPSLPFLSSPLAPWFLFLPCRMCQGSLDFLGARCSDRPGLWWGSQALGPRAHSWQLRVTGFPFLFSIPQWFYLVLVVIAHIFLPFDFYSDLFSILRFLNLELSSSQDSSFAFFINIDLDREGGGEI